MKVPSAADWGGPRVDLDKDHARKMFFGKSIADTQQMFATHPIERCEDLQFMPPVPFQYYIHGLKNFLLSNAAKGNPDAASCYLGLIQNKLECDPGTILPVMASLLPSVATVAQRQPFYDAPVSIYGDFREKRDQILRIYKDRGSRQP